MDDRGSVSRDEPRQTDMFIRTVSVKVAVALLYCSSFVGTPEAEAKARRSRFSPVERLLGKLGARTTIEKGSLNGK